MNPYEIRILAAETERKLAEEALLNTEARLHFALQTCKIGAWDLDLLDHTAHRTPLHDRIFGYEALLPNWTYEVFLEHVLPEDRPRVDESFREAMAAESSWNFECRIRRADGEIRWIWAAGDHDRNASGKPVRMAGVVQDITERRKEQEELRQYRENLEELVKQRTAELEREVLAREQAEAESRNREEKLAVTLHCIGDAVLVTDAERRITSLNPVAEALTGWTEADAMGCLVEEVFHIVNERTREPAVIPIDSVLQTGVVQGLANHTVLISREGTQRPIADSAAPIRDRDGRIFGVVLVFRDVTVEYAARKTLRESEERMRLATEAAGIAVWDWDVKSDAIKWDPGMFAIYGLPPTPEGWTCYEDWSSRVLPEDLPEQEEKLRHTVATCGRGHREFRITRASDNTVRVIQAAEKAIAGSNGKADRVVGINVDITERKEAEGRIAALNSDLAERAAQLAEANKELESFSYSVSHDLRAPLRHVHGYVEMLKKTTEGQLPDKAQRYLSIISDASVEMGQLIDDLLAFSRMSRAEMWKTAVNLNRTVEEILQGLDLEIGERNIVWKISPLPAAMADPVMIKQVFSNLIGNALKYSRERDPAEIEVGCAGEENGRRIYFVRDNGAGFDMRYAHKLFGVFQRLHGADEFEGTGIGLATVRRILTRHGDRVWAEGVPDKGATFYFTLKPADIIQP